MALFLHGVIANFYINGIHEMVHGTVFKSSWLNQIFLHIYSFLDWSNPYHFWESHTEHHKYTLHHPDDQEVVLPIRYSASRFWSQAFIHPALIWWGLHGTCLLALDRLPDNDWNRRLFPDTYPEGRSKVKRWAQVTLLGHALIFILSLLSGWWIFIFLINASKLFGGGLFWLCNNTQHVGLMKNSTDFRLNCRTIELHPIFKFLYWHMNYHIEHHMYAAVPCYNLARLHHQIRDQLPPTLNGLGEAWFQIITILKRQAQDPNYEFQQQIPSNRETHTHPSHSSSAEPKPQKLATNKPSLEPQTQGHQRIWECSVCGFIYDESLGLPNEGIAAGTAWTDIPDDWMCPDCGLSKAEFSMIEVEPNTESTPDASRENTASPDQNIVLVGSGMAAARFIQCMRQKGYLHPISWVSRDHGEQYSKPALSLALSQGKTAEELISSSGPSWAQRWNLKPHLNTEVLHIDPQQKSLSTSHGNIPYGTLVLATGAKPRELNITGAEHLLSIHHLDDYRHFRQNLPPRGQVSILGAGLIGCELAHDLAVSGHRVQLINDQELPLAKLLPVEAAQCLLEHLERLGVRHHATTQLKRVEQTELGLSLQLESELHSEPFESSSDLVISAIGLQANADWASSTGLQIDRGILVNEFQQTHVDHVYAIGDAAQGPRGHQPFVAAATQGAQILSDHLVGVPAKPWENAPEIHLKTPSLPVCIVSPPHSDGHWIKADTERGMVFKHLLDDNTCNGLVLMGDAVQDKEQHLQTLSHSQDKEVVWA